MRRANRCFLPDQVCHITHRCHKKKYLLKFSRVIVTGRKALQLAARPL